MGQRFFSANDYCKYHMLRVIFQLELHPVFRKELMSTQTYAIVVRIEEIQHSCSILKSLQVAHL